jgi:APA family basic amino acid/polyamine antiporter
MAVVCLVYGLTTGTLQQNFMTAAQVEGTSDSPLFAAVCATAFAYEGWIIATSINSEIRDSKKNLPKALIIGGLSIVAIYLFYYIGVAGGATNQELIDKGAPIAFTNIFGGVLGNILNLFIAISCLGTTNGLMLGCSRCMYALAERGTGMNPEMYRQVDRHTNMPTNSAVFALLISAAWFLYFYATNLACIWDGPFVFDSSELPIITVYAMYLPIIFQWMRKEKDEPALRRFVIPGLAVLGCAFMVFASILAHGWDCMWYLIVFVVIMALGGWVNHRNQKMN